MLRQNDHQEKSYMRITRTDPKAQNRNGETRICILDKHRHQHHCFGRLFKTLALTALADSFFAIHLDSAIIVGDPSPHIIYLDPPLEEQFAW